MASFRRRNLQGTYVRLDFPLPSNSAMIPAAAAVVEAAAKTGMSGAHALGLTFEEARRLLTTPPPVGRRLTFEEARRLLTTPPPVGRRLTFEEARRLLTTPAPVGRRLTFEEARRLLTTRPTSLSGAYGPPPLRWPGAYSRSPYGMGFAFSDVTDWMSANPGLAAGIAVGAAVLLMGMGRRRR